MRSKEYITLKKKIEYKILMIDEILRILILNYGININDKYILDKLKEIEEYINDKYIFNNNEYPSIKLDEYDIENEIYEVSYLLSKK